MIAAGRSLAERHPAELGCPDDQRILEESAGLEIFHERRAGLIGGEGHRRQLALDVAVIVPIVRRPCRATPDLHEAYPTFEQPPRDQAIAQAVAEVGEFFPEARGAQVVKAALTKEVRATFGVPPGIDSARPASASPWPNLFLAGDWIQTGWPSTMESAARSGHMAADALCAGNNGAPRFLEPDLKPQGLMTFFS